MHAEKRRIMKPSNSVCGFPIRHFCEASATFLPALEGNLQSFISHCLAHNFPLRSKNLTIYGKSGRCLVMQV